MLRAPTRWGSSTLAGAPQTQLNIGKSIFFNERIKSTGSGLVQVLLVDGSTFTVGPGSDLVIDKFVHNPSKGTGEIAATNTMTGSFNNPSALGAIQAALNLSPQFNLGFGGNGRSAFIDDKNFAAIEGEDGTSVSERYLATKRSFPFFEVRTYTDSAPEVQGFIVSADAIAADEILFPGQSGQDQKRAFCQSCNFIKWGAWGARVDYTEHTGQTATADVPLGLVDRR